MGTKFHERKIKERKGKILTANNWTSKEQGCPLACVQNPSLLSVLLLPGRGKKLLNLWFLFTSTELASSYSCCVGTSVFSLHCCFSITNLKAGYTCQQWGKSQQPKIILVTLTRANYIRKHVHQKLHKAVSAKINAWVVYSHLHNDRAKDSRELHDSLNIPKSYTALSSYVSVIK